MIKNYIKMLLKTLLLVLYGLIISLINDIFFRSMFPQFNKELRYLDHLVAGIGVTIIVYCTFRFLYDLLFSGIVKSIKAVKLKTVLHSNMLMISFSCLIR